MYWIYKKSCFLFQLLPSTTGLQYVLLGSLVFVYLLFAWKVSYTIYSICSNTIVSYTVQYIENPVSLSLDFFHSTTHVIMEAFVWFGNTWDMSVRSTWLDNLFLQHGYIRQRLVGLGGASHGDSFFVLKGQYHEIFDPRLFFHQAIPPWWGIALVGDCLGGMLDTFVTLSL
jgi:hypothetical protein